MRTTPELTPTTHTENPVHEARRDARGILGARQRHGAYRDACLGLVPTENRLSPLAQCAMTGDLSHRFHFRNPPWSYVGGKHLAEIDSEAQYVACDVFDAR